tara:strand:+ start:73 stop:237 length:165 start_codon:yes stop_codon:yes gene_type:complete
MSFKGRILGFACEALKLSLLTLVVLFIGFLTYEEPTGEEKAEIKEIFAVMTGFG